MDKVQELLNQIFELGIRINRETDLACWVDVSGHVNTIEVSVASSKKSFLNILTKHHLSYYKDYLEDNGLAEFVQDAKTTIDDLNQLLAKDWTKTYEAYCNLIDMSCSQVFTSEEAAKKWVRKMERKYKKVHAIVGYTEKAV